ncbi:putative proton-dependent oligopeptide transporter family [Medicago truncatula]|uniref:Putative proton-dependent oligopeptide transporter family n=1 Tax=Medicago truncatula TaxID=3880 RepID=A0A396H4N6_MEDTR|nr:putative proton-dependent oligopeptide transporter family [Medicago truncatula]
MVQVFVAALRKWNLNVPNDPKELHEVSIEEYNTSKGRYRINHSSSLRFLDKAAVKTDQTSPWMLCTVTQIEETKQMTKMIPILIASCIPSTIFAQTNTLFVKQGTTLDRRMGAHFKVPPASLIAFVHIFMVISIVIYDFVFVPIIRRYTESKRNYNATKTRNWRCVSRHCNGCFVSYREEETQCCKRTQSFRQARYNPSFYFHSCPSFRFDGDC